MAYRIHIDIPLVVSCQEEAVIAARAIMEILASPEALQSVKAHSGTQVNYRLGDDTDRQKSNYLVLTPSGHVTNQKCKILLTEEPSSVE